jgi:hypothetical protein
MQAVRVRPKHEGGNMRGNEMAPRIATDLHPSLIAYLYKGVYRIMLGVAKDSPITNKIIKSTKIIQNPGFIPLSIFSYIISPPQHSITIHRSECLVAFWDVKGIQKLISPC